ncbi:unnamed protein product, partial [Tilletia laevis]
VSRSLSRPAIDKLPTIYREIGTDYDERVLPSVVNGQYRFSADEPPGCVGSVVMVPLYVHAYPCLLPWP